MKLLSRISAFLPLAVSLIWLQFLPDRVPIHFDLSGNIDRWGSKWEHLIMPGIVLILGLIFLLLARYELKKGAGNEKALAHAKANQKVLQIAMIATGVLFAAMQGVLLYSASREASENAAKSSVDLSRVTVFGFGVLYIILGNYLPRAKKNSYVGFRCGWSMYNDVTWLKTNRFAGWISILTGVLIVLCAILLPGTWVMISFLILLGFSLVISLVYAAKVYQKEKKEAYADGSNPHG